MGRKLKEELGITGGKTSGLDNLSGTSSKPSGAKGLEGAPHAPADWAGTTINGKAYEKEK